MLDDKVANAKDGLMKNVVQCLCNNCQLGIETLNISCIALEIGLS
jgi:hypothetical protein